MPRILYCDEWYESVSSTALYESEYEQIVLEHCPILFPYHHATYFKLSVESEFGASRPDLALIHREYREWWIVEVEMAHHSLMGHVVPQVRRLANAAYGEREAKYLCARNSQLNLPSTLELMKGQPPRVFVVVNAPTPSWREKLEQHNALLSVFEIFRSARNEHIFRLNGDSIPTREEAASQCRFDSLLPRLLTVLSPAILPISRGERMSIHYKGDVTEWTRIDSADTVWLTPVDANPLDRSKLYVLTRNEEGTFSLKEGSL